MSESLEKKLHELELRVKKLENALTSASIATKPKTKKMSAKEFMLTKDLKTVVQEVLALCYFLEQNEGMESFNTNDIMSVFRLAKVKLPANINDTVNKNIAKGYIMEAADKKDTKKAWTLTASGETFVESELSK